MFYLDSSNKRYTIGRPFTYNGYYYGTALATHEKFIELGFTQVVVGARPDDRFYIVSGPGDDGTYTTTDRDLDTLKATFKAATKLTAYQLLKGTDWYVLRFIDGGFTDADSQIPNDIRTYRNSIRTASGTRCDEIDAVTTVAALKTLITTAEGESGGLTAFPTLANAASYYTY
jgi:hypothetical protein